jgi:DNA-binding NarL/FixJ family response regulator
MAFRLGALAFVPKDAPIAHLHEAIGEVLQRRRYLSPAVSTRPSRDPGTEALGFGLLTSRQQQIVRLIGQGLTSEQIAQKLGVSFHTINFHRKNLRRQLGIHSDWEMRRYALLVDLTDGSGSPGDDGVPSPAVPPSSGLPGSGPTGTADQPAQD